MNYVNWVHLDSDLVQIENLYKPTTLLKVTLLHECFSCFLNCTNGTKSRNAPDMNYVNWIHSDSDLVQIENLYT